MQIKRIEMQGFKTIADPVCIELNDGITCIVGPNGSGKSNISDALRWVLGEQSPKQLRGNKKHEVIFAGTTRRTTKGMAEISLVVDNSSGMLPVDYNEVAVTRRMYRSGESEYLINGNNCRLKDVRELFMDTGIGVDGYSIIGQGKIQEIVSTKPENRREIFEEAAGIVSYKTRKQDAERKLVSASDNLERVRDIISEIEDRIGGLAGRHGGVGQRLAHGVDGGAAEQGCRHGERVTEFLFHGAKHFHGFGNNLGANAVTRQQADRLLHSSILAV